MRAFLPSVLALFLVSSAFAQDHDALVADALEPLPDQLREGAKVVKILEDGEQVVIREGSNGITCRTDILPKPPYVVRCHPSSMESLFDRIDTLIQVEGHSAKEARDIVLPEIKDGTLPTPIPGSASYLYVGADKESAGLLTVIMLPKSTPEEIGIGDEEDHHRPWLMWGGTDLSHIMLYDR